MAELQKITPCLWFDGKAEEAAKFYTSIFEDSKILNVSHYSVGEEIHGQKPGSVMEVEFTLGGQTFTALNGGPLFKFTEALSLQVFCDSQAEVDRYWESLGKGGDPNAQQCGWLKDRFGVSWQIIPRRMTELLSDPDRGRASRAMTAMLQMKKLDIAALERAAGASK